MGSFPSAEVEVAATKQALMFFNIVRQQSVEGSCHRIVQLACTKFVVVPSQRIGRILLVEVCRYSNVESDRVGILDAERKQAVAHDVREAARRISFSVGYAANQLV